MSLKLKKYIYLAIFIACFVSCKNHMEGFLKVKNSFETEYVSHFPSEIEGNYEWYGSYSNLVDNFRLNLIHKIEPGSITELKKKYSKISKSHYVASERCLLIVNRFMNEKNSGKLKILKEHQEDINKECYKDKLPIPNFWNNSYTTFSSDCKLPPDSEIYVIDAKKGMFKEKELLSKRKDMPLEWEHGVSYGVAISEVEELIFYWMVMW